MVEFDLVYEDLEFFFPFQSMHAEDVHTDQFMKEMSAALNLKPTG
jgi:hypothetical protein